MEGNPFQRSRYRRLSQISSIQAPRLGSSSETTHIRHIQSKLAENGIVKISLGFPDSKSEYLERLIRNLHQYHGHGLPIDHSASRGWFWDVRPTATTTKKELPSIASSHSSSPQARSETREAFPWHTDCSYEENPPRYFALQVLQHDRCNGGTTSVLQVDQIVKYLSSSTLASLSKPEFAIKVPPEFIKKSDEREIVGSLLDISGQNPGTMSAQLRFREDIIFPLTNEASSALNEFSSVLHGPEIKGEIVQLTPEILPRGSVVLIDNRRWLHARKYASPIAQLVVMRCFTNMENSEVNDPERHLRRVRWDATPFPSIAELQPNHAVVNA
ncbi:hypothetical protein HYALB_00006871 [Hymenoscyphus albidus]|uniref:TauD/TfdA-like domain-containing protein n=1 Tax=Hymenoscyphus albidus TaxID=595503 RepID=A0A9N9Q2I5_9HELO|nr:hypothetical protein HYALB_00006871 [Hymenoscyphus albidus]